MTEQERDTILMQLTLSKRPAAILRCFLGTHYAVMNQEHNSVIFDFGGSRALNRCEIALNKDDLYDVTFWLQRRDGRKHNTKEYKDIFCDSLYELFERTTGLRLSFSGVGNGLRFC